MPLQLVRFRTRNFRSVRDSGWVDVDDVTALVGVNESGKSNLLLSLWKFNPAREGEIDPVPDYERSLYSEVRELSSKPVFITTVFAVDDTLAEEIAQRTGLEAKNFSEVEISRKLDGEYTWTFPQCDVPRSCAASDVRQALAQAKAELEPIEPFKKEADLKQVMISAVDDATGELGEGTVTREQLLEIKENLEVDASAAAETSKITPVYAHLISRLSELYDSVNRALPTNVDGLCDHVFSHVPKFVYYSNYGNLDSEIYLPQVIQNIERDDLGEKESAKARTLRVLFEFVKLSPSEILELGQEAPEQNQTKETIEAEAKRKKEREVLLTSASTSLTQNFRDWWKQGNYRFRFQADGRHFRIWVSDDLRPEEIELESRSTGLQWFFSFYLVFLVESQESHSGTILLLDEAGLSLHPLAQRDLSEFFESLPNQLLYTTHSPFLVEPDSLDQVRAVHVDELGKTVVSADLRANPAIESAKKSIYAVHVALGLSVSDTFLSGCLPVVVEGVSDQRYLTAIKNHLIGKGRITPPKDIVFLPAGGTNTKGITAVVSIVSARDEDLPFVLLDSDNAGTQRRNSLVAGTYAGFEDRVAQVNDFDVFENAEIEDLVGAELLAGIIGRYLPRPADSDDEFQDDVDPGKPIVDQVEGFAQQHGIELTKGWKVEVATRFKARLPKLNVGSTIEDRWTGVFAKLMRN